MSTAKGRPTFPQIANVLGTIFRLREARRNEIRFAADPLKAETARRSVS